MGGLRPAPNRKVNVKAIARSFPESKAKKDATYALLNFLIAHETGLV
jgi:hypothetical protein